MNSWIFTNDDGETITCSSSVWYDSRDFALRTLGTNTVKHVMLPVFVPETDYQIEWRGNDAVGNNKHKVVRRMTSRGWSEWVRL